MTQEIPDPVFVVLSDEDSAGRIVVDLEAFVRFTAQIDASLAALEARFPHQRRHKFQRRISHRRNHAGG